MKMRILLAVCLSLSIANQTASYGQVLGIGGKKANTEFVPGSVFAGAVLFPKKISQDPKFELFPREIVSAWGKKELGFDPMLINQITFVVKKIRKSIWAFFLSGLFTKISLIANSSLTNGYRSSVCVNVINFPLIKSRNC